MWTFFPIILRLLRFVTLYTVYSLYIFIQQFNDKYWNLYKTYYTVRSWEELQDSLETNVAPSWKCNWILKIIFVTWYKWWKNQLRTHLQGNAMCHIPSDLTSVFLTWTTSPGRKHVIPIVLEFGRYGMKINEHCYVNCVNLGLIVHICYYNAWRCT